MEGVAVAWPARTGASGVAAAAAIAAALLAGVLGVVAVSAGTAGVAGVSTDAALRVLPVPRQFNRQEHKYRKLTSFLRTWKKPELWIRIQVGSVFRTFVGSGSRQVNLG